MPREPKVTDNVEYFHNGNPNPNPSVGIVVAVGREGVLSLHVFARDGQSFYRDCVRHVSDPTLQSNPEMKRTEGAWRFAEENPANQPKAAKPEPQKQPAKKTEDPQKQPAA